MLNHIRKLFKKFDPFGMPFVELVLPLEVFKRLVVGMNDEFLWPQIMLPNLKYSNKCIQFYIISGIVESEVT